VEYPETGLYDPAARRRFTSDSPSCRRGKKPSGTVGVLIMRSYALAGNTEHYDGMIAPCRHAACASSPPSPSGLDARPAVERTSSQDGKPVIDACCR
jgi:magnesium chelatase subunit H